MSAKIEPAPATPKIKARSSPEPAQMYTSSTVRSGRSARSSSRCSLCQTARLPNARSVARISDEAVAKRSSTGPRARLRSGSPMCGASRRRSPAPTGAFKRKIAAMRMQRKTSVATSIGPTANSGFGTDDSVAAAAAIPGANALACAPPAATSNAVAGAGRREVGELPRPAELLCERRVDRLQRGRSCGAAVAAARFSGETLQRSRLEARAFDRDRIDGDPRIVGGGDRLFEARLARDLLAVCEQHEDARLVHVGGEQVRTRG